MYSFELSINLNASPEAVWLHARTFEGVNRELGPYLKMASPAAAEGVTVEDVETGEVVLENWILLGGRLPIDRHSLKVESISPGRGFHEISSSFWHRRWEHKRRLHALDTGGTQLTDILRIDWRLPVPEKLIGRAYRKLFEHRHRKLIKFFDEL